MINPIHLLIRKYKAKLKDKFQGNLFISDFYESLESAHQLPIRANNLEEFKELTYMMFDRLYWIAHFSAGITHEKKERLENLSGDGIPSSKSKELFNSMQDFIDKSNHLKRAISDYEADFRSNPEKYWMEFQSNPKRHLNYLYSGARSQ